MKKMNNHFYPAPAGVAEELEIQTSTLRLSTKCWGNPEGMPVLAFHGTVFKRVSAGVTRFAGAWII